MALNPLVDSRGYPQLFPGEIITIIYPGIYGSLHLTNNLRTRFSGTLFLTNARMVFLNKDPLQRQYNFALHLNLVSDERFIQNFPSVSVVEGNITPYANYLPAPGVFKFEMLQDPRPLVTGIRNFLAQIRSVGGANRLPMGSNTNQTIDSAFVDPNDPDIIYVVEQGKQ
jgi:hypothetical protein